MRTSFEPQSVLYQFPVSQIPVLQLYNRRPCCTHPDHDAPLRSVVSAMSVFTDHSSLQTQVTKPVCVDAPHLWCGSGERRDGVCAVHRLATLPTSECPKKDVGVSRWFVAVSSAVWITDVRARCCEALGLLGSSSPMGFRLVPPTVPDMYRECEVSTGKPVAVTLIAEFQVYLTQPSRKKIQVARKPSKD